MKYNKNATFSKELSSIQKTLDSYQRLYNTTAINAVSKSLMKFQSTMSKQLNTQAAAATLVMQQALSNQMSASIMQLSKMAESYNNLAKSIGSSLNQVAVRECAAKAKALASCINLNPSQTLVSGVASGILSNKNIDDDNDHPDHRQFIAFQPLPDFIFLFLLHRLAHCFCHLLVPPFVKADARINHDIKNVNH